MLLGLANLAHFADRACKLVSASLVNECRRQHDAAADYGSLGHGMTAAKVPIVQILVYQRDRSKLKHLLNREVADLSTSQVMSRVQDPAFSEHSDMRCGSTLGMRYRIERVLAKGGMATIYAAHDVILDRALAVKVLQPDLSSRSTFVDCFLDEARVLAKLRGPHTIRVFDYGTARWSSGQQIPFIVLELLHGVDLCTELQKSQRLAVPLAARYMVEACEGLAEAHGAGVIHCDIKPDNLFLARKVDGTTTVKLLDFGISKSRDQSGLFRIAHAPGIAGTPLYMAPEQITATPVDTRTDIWALGAVMFECVAGRPPFEGATVSEICARVLNAPLPDLNRLNPEVPDAFVRIVNRCLEREPMDRFQNVAELACALKPLATPIDYSETERIGHVIGIEPSQPTVEEEELEFQAHLVDDIDFSKRDIPGLQRDWRLGVVVLLSVLCPLSYVGYRFPKEAMEFLVAAWQQSAPLFDMMTNTILNLL